MGGVRDGSGRWKGREKGGGAGGRDWRWGGGCWRWAEEGGELWEDGGVGGGGEGVMQFVKTWEAGTRKKKGLGREWHQRREREGEEREDATGLRI